MHVRHGVNRMGKRVHYYFNYSGAEVKAAYAYAAGTNLLDGKAVKGRCVALGAWDVAIVEENGWASGYRPDACCAGRNYIGATIAAHFSSRSDMQGQKTTMYLTDPLFIRSRL